jgi:uncharacterized membrane protein
MPSTIGNPLSWSVDRARSTSAHLGAVAARVNGNDATGSLPDIRTITTHDLREALRLGVEDFAESRSDVIFLCLLYPLIGAALVWLALDLEFLPLIFPVISGFALLGPVAGVGLYEMSRRREMGQPIGWGDAFAVTRSPQFGAVFVLGLLLAAIFLIWILTAQGIYAATLGPEPPGSFGAFVAEVFGTAAGWAMIVIGMAAGFLFAALVLTISVVSFPLLLDRDVSLRTAVITSIRLAAANPRTVAIWGAIVAGSLAIGSLPVFLGLIVVLPVLGHATWHLYRRSVVAPDERRSVVAPTEA